MADFEQLPVKDGYSDFHLNRFRIAFDRPQEFTKEMLAQDFITNFPTYLKSDVATVEFRKDRLFNSKTTLQFWGALKLLWGHVEANFLPAHHDWVVQEWVDSRIGFTAQTLKRTFLDPDDAAAGVGSQAPFFVPGVGTVLGANPL